MYGPYSPCIQCGFLYPLVSFVLCTEVLETSSLEKVGWASAALDSKEKLGKAHALGPSQKHHMAQQTADVSRQKLSSVPQSPLLSVTSDLRSFSRSHLSTIPPSPSSILLSTLAFGCAHSQLYSWHPSSHAPPRKPWAVVYFEVSSVMRSAVQLAGCNPTFGNVSGFFSYYPSPLQSFPTSQH